MPLPDDLAEQIKKTLAEGKELDREYEEKIGEIDGRIYGEADTAAGRFALWERLGVPVTKQGNPIANLHSAYCIIKGFSELREQIWFDTFTKKIMTSWKGKLREWSDSDDVRLLQFVQKNAGISRMTKNNVQDAMLLFAKDNQRSEFKEWLDEQVWDGVERIEYFFTAYMGAKPSDYCRAVSKNFWLGMVARGLNAGCQVDNMVILEGPQGILKSSSLSAIGGKWFAELHESVKNKDFKLALQGKLLIEIGEMESFSKAEISTIKGIVTDRNDRFRVPWDKYPQDFPRACVFVGTTNEDNYLRDVTGARRFWPIRAAEVDVIRLDDIKKLRGQFFAEAKTLLLRGASWWEVPESALAEQEARRQRDAWEELIEKHIDEAFMTQFSVKDLAVDPLGIAARDLDMSKQIRIARCLRALGLTKHKVGGNIVWKRENDS